LSQLLKVPPHPNPLITLESCCKVIQTRLNEKAICNPNKVVGSVSGGVKVYLRGLTVSLLIFL